MKVQKPVRNVYEGSDSNAWLQPLPDLRNGADVNGNAIAIWAVVVSKSRSTLGARGEVVYLIGGSSNSCEVVGLNCGWHGCLDGVKRKCLVWLLIDWRRGVLVI